MGTGSLRPLNHFTDVPGSTMRIAIISHLKHAIVEPFAGGLEMHTHLLATRLRARGHDVVLFASTRSDPATGLTAICDETALMAAGVAEATDIAFFREHHADRKSTRLNSSHHLTSRMPSSA